MESKKGSKKAQALEHRRAQNRLAQRRFRQRQSQQKAIANQPPQQDLELHVSTNDEPFDIFNLLPATGFTRSPVAVKSPSSSLGFGVNCLQGGANGLIGIQNFINMDDLGDLTPSSLLAAPPPAISNTESLEHATFGSDRESYRKYPGSLGSTSSSSSTHGIALDSLDTGSLPRALTDDSTPARPSSASALRPGIEKEHDAGSGWLSALHIAAQKGHHRIMRVLLKHDIDCNEVDSDGLTPLIHATIGGHEDVVTLLLLHGARIDKVDRQGRSLLHFAVIHRREALLKILLDYYGGDQVLIDGYDSSGRTPLHTAVDTGFEAGVQVLLNRGASVHYRTKKTAIP